MRRESTAGQHNTALRTAQSQMELKRSHRGANSVGCALERRSVSCTAGPAATKLCAGDSPCGGEPPSGESPPVDPCQLSFEMPCSMRVDHASLCWPGRMRWS